MREVQARLDFLLGSLNTNAWPACSNPCGSGSVHYPPDGYYGDLSEAQGVCLAEAVCDAAAGMLGSFLKESVVDGIDGSTSVSFTTYSTADFPGLITGSSINATNYVQAFAYVMSNVLPKLHYTHDGSAVLDVTEHGAFLGGECDPLVGGFPTGDCHEIELQCFPGFQSAFTSSATSGLAGIGVVETANFACDPNCTCLGLAAR